MATAVRPRPGAAPGDNGGGVATRMLGYVPKWLAALPASIRQNAKDYFAFTADFLPLASLATQSVSVNITSDAAFLILAGTRIVTTVDNLTFLSAAPELVSLTDTGSGRALSSAAVHIEMLFGDAQDPAEWQWPKLMSPASTLTVQVQNLEAVARNVRLAFHGMKIFGFAEVG